MMNDEWLRLKLLHLIIHHFQLIIFMRICFIGDSFVNGTGDPECLGWAGRICVTARKLKSTARN